MQTPIQAKARLTAGEVSTSLTGVLKRMAYTVDPANATDKSPNLRLGTNICHGLVALEIKKRGNPDDLIWFYGTGPTVMHSVLTNEDHQVLVDSFKRSGKFLGAQGYGLRDDKLDLVDVVPVSELFDDYMSYQVTAEATGDKGNSDAAKSKKEAIDRQLENNKRQQESVKQGGEGASPVQKIDKQKQVNRLRDRALELRKQKLES